MWLKGMNDKCVIQCVKSKLKTKILCLQVCHRRDLMPGTDELTAIIDLISEYCRRVILLFTQKFINSQVDLFYASFAQAWDMSKCQRKLIPCLYEDVKKEQLPKVFQNMFVLRYDSSHQTKLDQFYDRLCQSINSASSIIAHRMPMTKSTITEIDAPLALMPAMQHPSQPQTVFIGSASDSRTPKPSPRKRKDKSISPKSQRETKNSLKLPKAPKISSPSTPNSSNLIYPPSPKLRSQSRIATSMSNLSAGQLFGKESESARSTRSLNSPALKKEKKTWSYLNIFRSPNSSSAYKLSADSDSSMGMEKTKKKKSWYRKRFRSKNRVLAKEVWAGRHGRKLSLEHWMNKFMRSNFVVKSQPVTNNKTHFFYLVFKFQTNLGTWFTHHELWDDQCLWYDFFRKSCDLFQIPCERMKKPLDLSSWSHKYFFIVD